MSHPSIILRCRRDDDRTQESTLDPSPSQWFREQADAAGGANYQTLINQALREYIEEKAEPLEEKIRRIVREEIPRYGP